MVYGVADIISGRRHDILQHRDEVQTNLVALNISHHVGTVSDIILTDRVEIRQNIMT
jgi:hypothetical protein